MEKRVAVYNNNTGVIEIMSSLLAGEGLKMVTVTGRAQLQELLRDRKSTRLNSSHTDSSRMPSSA